MSEFLERHRREREAVAAALREFSPGVHYLQNEEGKPTLMDAGAALLRDALGLYPDGHRIVQLREEPGGHLRVVLSVTLYERQSGRPRASGIGSASSRELLSTARRLVGELDPGNVACKLAAKRAEVDAMLGIPAVCERFAQDVGLRPLLDPETGEVREAPAPPHAPAEPPAEKGHEEAPAPTPPPTAASTPSPPEGLAPSLVERSRPSAPYALRGRPSPEEVAAQRKALAIARKKNATSPYAFMAQALGIPVQGMSPVAAVLRWLDQGHSWQEVAHRLEQAEAS